MPKPDGELTEFCHGASMRLRQFVWLSIVTLLIGTSHALAGAESASFSGDIRPLLEKYCFECHGAQEKKKADVDLAPFKSEQDLSGNQQLWLDVQGQLTSYAMPPAKSPQPTEAERKVISDWIENAMDRLDEKLPMNAGRVPLRRLNREEYNNTVRDLVGIDLRPADDFPQDDTAHGFDNVAEGLSLSPMLLEKYLQAAEKIVGQTTLAEGEPQVLRKKIEIKSLLKGEPTNEVAELKLEQEVSSTVEVAATEEYEIVLRAGQTGATPDPATIVLKVDGVDTHVWTFFNEELKSLRAVVPLREGVRKISLRHTWFMEIPKEKQRVRDARAQLDWLSIAGPLKAVAHERIFFVKPAEGVSEKAAAAQVIGRFAERAFRRPVPGGELSPYLELYSRGRANGKSHLAATRLALVSVLVSPHFLFKIERDEKVRDAAGGWALNDSELANRLSYFLWSSMPDEALFQSAREGKLQQRETLEAQVKRMLADPKARALANNFAGQWLGVRKLESAAPDPEMFASFKPGLREAMRAEAISFFDAVVQEDRSILEFLNSDWTILNEELARHYSIRDVMGGHMRKVALTDSIRGGVITMAGVLTVTSHPTRTSAVKRGKWVLEEIFGAAPPPPPPGTPELEVPPKGQSSPTSLRERLERHRADPKCFGCHVRMDALGLGLENFDPIGRWREKEGKHVIDASGTLPGGGSFKTPAELKEILMGQKNEFTRTFVEKMLVYALGRGLERHDRREVKRISKVVAEREYRFSALVTEIVLSYPFRYRHD